jgi:mannose-1-phosphate guanylyltransferase / phosphomannomutase
MKALIQAGGMGTRLRPITYEIPKPLLPVKKKPITNHLIDLFHRNGVEDIGIIVARPHAEDFRRWQRAWEDELDKVKVSIFVEETPRGTFGGLEPLRDWLDTPFFMTNADDLKDLDLRAMQEIHGAERALATLALTEVPNPRDYGVVRLEGNRIAEFLEKSEAPPSNLINAGLYLLDPSVLGYADFGKAQVSIEKDIFPKLAADGKLAGFLPVGGRWYDCGNLERWERAMMEW